MGTTGSTQQTWNLLNGGRSGLFDRDRSKDYFFGKDHSANSVATNPAVVGALTAIANQTPSIANTTAMATARPGRSWSDDELADAVTGSSSGPSSTRSDSSLFQGGLGLPTFAADASKTALGIGGTLAGIPSPVSSILSGLVGAGMSDEGLNAHTATNAGLNTLFGLNPVTGIANLVGKFGAKLLGNDWDIADKLGSLTNTPELNSLRTLNLNSFANDSNDAFKGMNQSTMAAIKRQEDANKAEHDNFTDTYQKAQDAAVKQRMADAAIAEAQKVAADREAALQSFAPQITASSTGSGGARASALQQLADSGAFDTGSSYGFSGFGPMSSSSGLGQQDSSTSKYSGVGSSPASGGSGEKRGGLIRRSRR